MSHIFYVPVQSKGRGQLGYKQYVKDLHCRRARLCNEHLQAAQKQAEIICAIPQEDQSALYSLYTTRVSWARSELRLPCDPEITWQGASIAGP